jgi:hypothetical protein
MLWSKGVEYAVVQLVDGTGWRWEVRFGGGNQNCRAGDWSHPEGRQGNKSFQVSYFDQSPISVFSPWAPLEPSSKIMGNAVRRKQIDRDSDSLPADLFLGVTIAGVSTLIGIGLIIVFAWKTASVGLVTHKLFCGYVGHRVDSPESQISNFPQYLFGRGSIMDAFERMCLGSALTGFVILVVATLTLVVAT